MRPNFLRSLGILSLCAGISIFSSACCVTNCEEDAAEGTEAPLQPSETPIQDLDQDGISIDQGDCNDSNATVYPGAEEIPYDGIDQDCSGSDLIDVDGDGYPGGGHGPDCNDNDVLVHPGADDAPYDGIDQDCTGDDVTDNDGDGYPGGEGGTDCNDNDPQTYPGAPEYSYDGIDQDCDGSDWTDIDGDGYSGGEGGTDCDDGAEYTYPGAYEAPDGVDNDCDGLVDEDTATATPAPESSPETSPAPTTPPGSGDGDPIETPVSGLGDSVIAGCDCSTVPGQNPGPLPVSALLLALLPIRRLLRRR